MNIIIEYWDVLYVCNFNVCARIKWFVGEGCNKILCVLEVGKHFSVETFLYKRFTINKCWGLLKIIVKVMKLTDTSNLIIIKYFLLNRLKSKTLASLISLNQLNCYKNNHLRINGYCFLEYFASWRKLKSIKKHA